MFLSYLRWINQKQWGRSTQVCVQETGHRSLRSLFFSKQAKSRSSRESMLVTLIPSWSSVTQAELATTIPPQKTQELLAFCSQLSNTLLQYMLYRLQERAPVSPTKSWKSCLARAAWPGNDWHLLLSRTPGLDSKRRAPKHWNHPKSLGSKLNSISC